MKQPKENPTVSGEAKKEVQTDTTPVNTGEHIFQTIDANEMTSVVNGNRVLFLGKGVREIIVKSDN